MHWASVFGFRHWRMSFRRHQIHPALGASSGLVGADFGMHRAGVFSFARLAHRFGDPNGRLIVELGDGFVGDSDGVGNSALDNLDDD